MHLVLEKSSIAPATTRLALPVLLFLLASLSSPALAQPTVGQWEAHEISLTSVSAYANPFTDVEVYADFVAPSGGSVRVYAFHDGNGAGGQGNGWKLRFMTAETGDWTWRTVASNSLDGGLHDRSGTVTVTPSAVRGPLRPDPLHATAWRHADGTPYLWSLGYAIFMAGADRHHPGVGGWQDYLDWLEARAFGGVLLIIQVPSIQTCSTCWKGRAPWSALGGHPAPTWAVQTASSVDYFVMPWARNGNADATGTSFANTDFDRFYLPLWRNLDQIVLELQRKGMIAHVWQYGDDTFHPPAGSVQEQRYWDYMIRRLGGFWNVVFNDGIDLGEYRSIPAWVDQWQQHFAANDPFDHARSSRHGSDDPEYATWRSVQAADDTQPLTIGDWRSLMAAAPAKPVTEDDGIRARKGSGIPASRFRQLAWWSALAGPGAFGATWAGAHEPANWFSNLDDQSEGMRDVERRNRFLLELDPAAGTQVPFWRLEVRDDLVTGNDVYCAAAGEHFLVYFDQGAPTSANVDLQTTVRALPMTWLDPETGQRQSGGMSVLGAIQTVTNPYPGTAVLYIGEGEAAIGGQIFADGFESGDLSAWSSAVP